MGKAPEKLRQEIVDFGAASRPNPVLETLDKRPRNELGPEIIDFVAASRHNPVLGGLGKGTGES